MNSARTLPSILAETAARFPNAAALHQGDRVYTWSEYCRAAVEVAAGLAAAGIGRGDVVALVSDARLEFYLADLGTMASGAAAAALYASYPVPELVRTLCACRARAVFVESPELAAAVADEPRCAGVTVIRLTGAPDGVMTLGQLCECGRAWLEAGGQLPGIEPGDHAILYLTSGALGEPKMGFATHAAILANLEMGPQVLDLSPGDAMLAFLSPAHIMQRLVVELLPILAGVPVWFAASLFQLPQEFARVRPTVFLAPPRFWERVHASIRTEVRKRGRVVEAAFGAALRLGFDAYRRRRDGIPLSVWRRALAAAADRVFFRRIRARFGGRLKVCGSGSAPLGTGLAEFFLGAGVPLIEGYGLTEGGVVLLNRPGRTKPGSVGQPLPGVEVRLGSDGELLVRSPTLFAGYYDDPEATAAVLRDGWLHTGDLAAIGSGGYVTITGRKKEVIVASSGRKVYPARIEALFGTEPIVSHIVVIGEGRPHVTALMTLNTAAAGELPGMSRLRGAPVAELAKAPPVAAAVRSAVARANAHLADFEQIRKYHLLDRDFTIDAGELTATLKVRRARVLEEFRDLIDTLYGGRS